jgi:hypothetical protein
MGDAKPRVVSQNMGNSGTGSKPAPVSQATKLVNLRTMARPADTGM